MNGQPVRGIEGKAGTWAGAIEADARRATLQGIPQIQQAVSDYTGAALKLAAARASVSDGELLEEAQKLLDSARKVQSAVKQLEAANEGRVKEIERYVEGLRAAVEGTEG